VLVQVPGTNIQVHGGHGDEDQKYRLTCENVNFMNDGLLGDSWRFLEIRSRLTPLPQTPLKRKESEFMIELISTNLGSNDGEQNDP
jgi:hypothetical protein